MHRSGGHHTDAVYSFSKANLGRKWWAIKGESARTGFRNPVWPVKRPSSRSRKSFRPIIIGVNAAKDFVRDALHKDTPGARYMHFNGDWDQPAFEQLTAERSRSRVKVPFASANGCRSLGVPMSVSTAASMPMQLYAG
jgi:phage terminase large subunit GpA-like protein